MATASWMFGNPLLPINLSMQDNTTTMIVRIIRAVITLAKYEI